MKFYLVRDIEQLLGVTEKTVLGWLNSGELKGANCGVTPGKKKPRWRVSQESLDAFLALRTPTPAVPATRRQTRKTEGTMEFIK